jgi:hypothetical protein
MSPEDARYPALREFDNLALVNTQTREVWCIGWLEQFLRDTRVGAHVVFTIAALSAITLGINVCIFRP